MLFCLLPLSRRSTRHRRSVQAVGGDFWEGSQKTPSLSLSFLGSLRAGVSECKSRSIKWETGLLRFGWHLEQHGLSRPPKDGGSCPSAIDQGPGLPEASWCASRRGLRHLVSWSSPGPLCHGSAASYRTELRSEGQREAGLRSTRKEWGPKGLQEEEEEGGGRRAKMAGSV